MLWLDLMLPFSVFMSPDNRLTQCALLHHIHICQYVLGPYPVWFDCLLLCYQSYCCYCWGCCAFVPNLRHARPAAPPAGRRGVSPWWRNFQDVASPRGVLKCSSVVGTSAPMEKVMPFFVIQKQGTYYCAAYKMSYWKLLITFYNYYLITENMKLWDYSPAFIND